MPTEHEYKFVISCDAEAELANKPNFYAIEQGYLAFSKGMSTRIRSIRKVDSLQRSWFFTFKQKTKTRVIEIEKKISARDGEDLWKMAVGKLKKYRHKKRDAQGRMWDLDFFHNKQGKCYFAVAEVELEEGAPQPKKLPPFIKKFLVFAAPLTDDRFSNKRLGDVEYATDLYQELVVSKERSK
jgi:CYTH domain-containing protein